MRNSTAQNGNSEPGILRSRFTSMLRQGYSTANGGYGIRFLDTEGGHILDQEGLGNTEQDVPSFLRCEHAIHAEAGTNGVQGSLLISRNNHMDNVELGYRIITTTGDLSDTIINNRIISDIDYQHDPNATGGIWIDDNLTNASGHWIEQNNITVNHPEAKPGFGVLVRGNFNPNANPNFTTILSNFIDVQVGRSCVHLSQFNTADVDENNLMAAVGSVPAAGNIGLFGVFSIGGGNHMVHCNTITGPVALAGTPLLVYEGMRYDGQTGTQAFDNTVTNFERGTTFASLGMNIFYGCNTLGGTMNIGLLYDNGTTPAATNNQINTGNIWPATATYISTIGAEDAGAGTTVYQARTGTPEFPPAHTPATFFTNWPGGAPVCPVQGACGAVPTARQKSADILLDDLDTTIAENNLNVPEGMLWGAEEYLYAKLKDHPAVLEINDLMQAFVAARDNTVMEDFYNIATGIRAMHEVSPETQAVLDEHTAAIASLMQQLADIRNAMPEEEWSDEYQALAAEYETLMQEVVEHRQANLDTYQALHDERVAAADVLVEANSSIDAETQAQINEQQFFDAYLRSFGKDTSALDSIRTEQMRTLALQCPADGGRAVYWAIGLYGQLTGELIEPQECEGAEFQPGGIVQQLKVSVADFNLYPNPSSGEVTVGFELEKGQSGRIEITDQTGTVKALYPVADTDGSVKINRLPAGVYFVRLSVDGASDKVKKLLIF